MKRAYLNSFSFPAESVEDGMNHLAELRKGIGRLFREKAVAAPIMCGVRAGQLPLTKSYDTLTSIPKDTVAKFRDTVLFFLTALDQKSPVHSALSEADKAEADPSVVDHPDCEFDPHAGTALVACALDDGVLLSIGTNDRWRSSAVSVAILTASAEAERPVVLANACDDGTAQSVATELATLQAKHRFDNWEHLTGGAAKSEQLDVWFKECLTKPGLEQVIMRSLSQAFAAEWRPDGDLVKKLNVAGDTPVFEVRAWFNGSNNVRILFGRLPDGSVGFGHGGQKSHPDWYDKAVPSTERFLSGR